MPDPTNPRVRQRLGQELQALRTLAGLTQRDLAARIPLGQVGISRVENGTQLVSRVVTEAWLSVTGAPEVAAERVWLLVGAAHGETRSWAEVAAITGGLQAVAEDREDRASLIRDCCLTWLPGLCQTAEYARLLIAAVDVEQAIDQPAAVAKRLLRQQVLYRDGRRFKFLIGEEALRWSPGPASVMVGQRAHLAAVAGLPCVEVRVLQSSRCGDPAWHNFTLYDPANGSDHVVTTELLHGGQETDEAAAVAAYETHWDRMWQAAAAHEAALKLIRAD